MDAILVTTKTPMASTFLTSSTAKMETALIMRRLKAADPTIVDAPNSPGSSSMNYKVSMQESKISGALEPKAIRDKFAIVGFQTFFSMLMSLPSASYIVITDVLLVISSIAL